jgi:hypothetical protein
MTMTTTTTDWEQFGRENGSLGRYELRAMLEAAGLELNSRDYHLAFEAIRRGQSVIEQARAAQRAEAERARLAPFIAAARADAASWGCVEAGDISGEELEQMILREAQERADEADERAAEEARAAERAAAELLDYQQRQTALDACERAAEVKVLDAGWKWTRRRCGHDCSRYFWIERHDDEVVFSLRISDHHAKNGSGWNEAKQEQYDAPNVNIVIRSNGDGTYGFDLAKLTERLD